MKNGADHFKHAAHWVNAVGSKLSGWHPPITASNESHFTEASGFYEVAQRNALLAATALFVKQFQFSSSSSAIALADSHH
ncbi:unnamed protein product [Litomosoides sigmodontis]|uniref:Uncharacterized protein n=1 Tax=Litomosoides sigmodontis TaxID=42156 RepID=A0A3P6S2U2_LITSI|nr:unnamed protein product [Litomosoides sigmodontis]